MAYADQQMSGSRVIAIALVVLIHLAIGYALITGLAYSAAKKLVERVTTVDIEEPPPPEEDVPPPPPEPETAPFLREIDHGPDENCTEDKVQARIGAAALAEWDAAATPPPGWSAGCV